MDIIFIIAGIGVGAFVSIITFLTIFNNGKITAMFQATAGPAVPFFTILKEIRTENFHANYVIEYICAYFVSVSILLLVYAYLFIKHLNKNNYPITFIEFITDREEMKKCFKEYRDRNKKLSELQQREVDVAELEEELKMRESVLKQQEQTLNAIIEDNGVFLELPCKSKIVLGNDFIESMPTLVNNYCKFQLKMSEMTDNLISRIEANKNHSSKFKTSILKDFLENTCSIISNTLFNENEVRVHFRYLKDKEYKKVILYSEGKSISEELKIIKYNEGMIYSAAKLKRSLIKSLNSDNHIPGSNDSKWVDYITIVFDKFYENNSPILAMGIDMKSREKYKNELYFLNYCRIEANIQNCLIELNRKMDIISKLESLVSA